MANWGKFEWLRRWFVLPKDANSVRDIARKLGRDGVEMAVGEAVGYWFDYFGTPEERTRLMLNSVAKKLSKSLGSSLLVLAVLGYVQDRIISLVKGNASPEDVVRIITDAIMGAD